MKLSMTVEADTINVRALNGGRIVVDIDGIELASLIDVVCDNGYSLRIADEPGKLIVEDPLPPVARVNGIQCSTAHITEKDNALLFTLSHQYEDFGESGGFCIPAPAPYSTWRHGHFRFCGLNGWGCRKPVDG